MASITRNEERGAGSETPSSGHRAGIQPATLNTYHVFLASPGDVQAERAAVRAFFERINTTDGRHRGFRFEVVDWENYSSAGAGRPQDLITEQTLSRYRASLALVIGIMAQRFGSPSGTHESGTEEEFEWALAASQGELPEIKWFFRELQYLTIPTAAGSRERIEAFEQWDKVQAFRRRIDEGKLAHYRTYTDLEDFKECFDGDLRIWLNAPNHPWNAKRADPEPSRRQLPPRDQRFRGRLRELASLRETLLSQHNVGVTQRVGAWGHGGLGKSALAIEYAWRHIDDYPGGIYWLSADVPALVPGLASLAPALGLPESMNANETAARVRSALSAGAPALLILDNVPDHEWLRAQQPVLPVGRCQLLVTTRAEALPGIELVRLDRLDDADGRELLVALTTPRGDANSPKNVEPIARIVKTCEGLAVALVAAGAYLACEPNVPWADYARSLEQRGLAALRASSNRARATVDYAPSLDLVFSDLFSALPAAQQRVLEYATLLPADGVPDFWLHDLLDHEDVTIPDAPGYERAARAVVHDLVQRHLLRRLDDRERFVAMHRLFAAWIAERLAADPAARAALLSQIARFAAARANVVKQAAVRPELRPELTPLVALVGILDEHGDRPGAAELATLLWALEDLGRYSEWRSVLERFVSETGHELGPEHEEIGTAVLSNLAIILRHLGDLAGARRRIDRAIDIKERDLPPDHLSLAATYSVLALILQDLGDLPGARARIERAIAIEEKYFPSGHFSLATSYSNLGLILRDLGDQRSARARVEHAINILQEHYPPDHLSLATPYSNLALILQDVGNLNDARLYFDRVLGIIERHFPPDHPSFATPYSNLSLILRDLDDLPNARVYAERSIDILERHFPADHPDLASAYSNFALVLRDLGDLTNARARVEHAIHIWEKHFLPDHPNHPDLATAYSNLALVLKDLGDSPHEKNTPPCASTHLAAAAQLRDRAVPAERFEPAAVLREPVGSPGATPVKIGMAEAREALINAITKVETALRAENMDRPARLPEARPIVGNWSLVDQVEYDGHRYIVARAPTAGPSALTEREKQIIALAQLGHHNKLIAYELGIATSTVRVLMARAAAKLGVRSREELLRTVDPPLSRR